MLGIVRHRTLVLVIAISVCVGCSANEQAWQREAVDSESADASAFDGNVDRHAATTGVSDGQSPVTAGSDAPMATEQPAGEATEERTAQGSDVADLLAVFGLTTEGFVGLDTEFEGELLVLRDQIVHECMIARGFDYFPVSPAERFVAAPDLGVDPGTVAYAEQFGFGISTLLFSDAELDGAAIGSPAPLPQRATLDAEGEDDLSNYLDSLSEVGQQQYWVALFGAASPAGVDVSSSEFDESCQREAFRTVPDPRTKGIERWGSELIDSIEARLDADPLLAAAINEAELCMNRAGYDFLVMQPSNLVYSRLEVLEREFGVGFEVLSNPLFIDQLGEIQRFEIELATTAFVCEADEWTLGRLRAARLIEIAAETSIGP